MFSYEITSQIQKCFLKLVGFLFIVFVLRQTINGQMLGAVYVDAFPFFNYLRLLFLAFLRLPRKIGG